MCGANLLKICEINTKYFYKETLPQPHVLTRNTPPEQTSDKTNVHNSGSPSFWLAQLASQTRNVKKSRPFLCQHAEQLKKQVEPSNPLKTVAHRTPIVHYSKPHYLRHSYNNLMVRNPQTGTNRVSKVWWNYPLCNSQTPPTLFRMHSEEGSPLL